MSSTKYEPGDRILLLTAEAVWTDGTRSAVQPGMGAEGTVQDNDPDDPDLRVVWDGRDSDDTSYVDPARVELVTPERIGQVGPLYKLAAEIAQINEDNGWYATSRTFGDDVALMHSEVSEAFEEYRAGHLPNVTRYHLDVSPGSPAVQRFGLVATEEDAEALGLRVSQEAPELMKPEGIPSELADVLIRVLDTAGRYGIDLDAAVAEKLAYNRTRGHRHGGKVV